MINKLLTSTNIIFDAISKSFLTDDEHKELMTAIDDCMENMRISVDNSITDRTHSQPKAMWEDNA